MRCVDQSVAGSVLRTVRAACTAADEMPKAAREGSDLFFPKNQKNGATHPVGGGAAKTVPPTL
jgi:hypothetical protein